MDKISVIVPCYCEEEAIPIFYQEMEKVQENMQEVVFEYLFVNDGSTDRTLGVLKALAQKDKKVSYLSFSRNFGKEAAMYAGMEHASGDYIVIMDVDLQDPPSLLPQMYHLMKEEGYDCVASRRVNRAGEAKIRSFFARCFYKLINHISKTEIVDGARDFRMMTRQMTESILRLCEYNRFSKGIFSWVGFETKWLAYENVKRSAGETKWSFWKLFKYSIDGIVAFSTAPLAMASLIGLVFCLLSVAGIIVTIIRQLVWGVSAYGWSSMVCILLLVGGVQLFCMGILGQYLSKTYMEVKHRPIYIVKEQRLQDDVRPADKEAEDEN